MNSIKQLVEENALKPVARAWAQKWGYAPHDVLVNDVGELVIVVGGAGTGRSYYLSESALTEALRALQQNLIKQASIVFADELSGALLRVADVKEVEAAVKDDTPLPDPDGPFWVIELETMNGQDGEKPYS